MDLDCGFGRERHDLELPPTVACRPGLWCLFGSAQVAIHFDASCD